MQLGLANMRIMFLTLRRQDHRPPDTHPEPHRSAGSLQPQPHSHTLLGHQRHISSESDQKAKQQGRSSYSD